jgi:AcrR family transcriptional regulator
MVAATADMGYARAGVAAVIAHAGVSRPTFYDYFGDRDNCFLATIADVQQRLLEEVRGAVDAGAPEDAAAAAAETLVRFAVAQPAMARFLSNDALSGPVAALDARDRGIAEIAQIVEEAFARAPARQALPDLPLEMMLGAVQRLLASRLRRGERALDGLLEDLLGWLGSYERSGERRWRTLTPGPAMAPSPFLSATPLQPQARFKPGRVQVPAEAVAENHRQRIMLATCEVVNERGYTKATVAEITRLAGVDGSKFYSRFASKQEAFSAVYELGFRHLMTTAAGAFFAGDSWPERMWETMLATTQTLQSEPALAHMGLIEAHAVGPEEIQRVEDGRIAFTTFLREGYRYDARRTPPSDLALEAIMATVFEIVYREARRSANRETPGLLPHIVYLCLTPFMGPKQANGFIDRKLSENGRVAGGRAGRSRNGRARASRGQPDEKGKGRGRGATSA